MASTTFVDNSSIIYASWLNDINATTYNGTFISSTITPSNLVCNGSVSGTGFTGLVNNTLSAPGQIGNGTPNTGAFTTLSTSGLATLSSLTVSGASNLGTPTTLVGTNITGTANSLNAGIGVNQTWQNLTASRALSTTYTNSTGKPIQVLVSGGYNSTNTAYMTITVDGVLLQTFNVSISGLTGGSAVVGAIVPNGSTYIVASIYGPIQRWTELR
jgi:hypothetical protein